MLLNLRAIHFPKAGSGPGSSSRALEPWTSPVPAAPVISTCFPNSRKGLSWMQHPMVSRVSAALGWPSQSNRFAVLPAIPDLGGAFRTLRWRNMIWQSAGTQWWDQGAQIEMRWGHRASRCQNRQPPGPIHVPETRPHLRAAHIKKLQLANCISTYQCSVAVGPECHAQKHAGIGVWKQVRQCANRGRELTISLFGATPGAEQDPSSYQAEQ